MTDERPRAPRRGKPCYDLGTYFPRMLWTSRSRQIVYHYADCVSLGKSCITKQIVYSEVVSVLVSFFRAMYVILKRSLHKLSGCALLLC